MNFKDMMRKDGDQPRPTKSKGLGKPPSITVDYIFAGPIFDALDKQTLETDINQSNMAKLPKIILVIASSCLNTRTKETIKNRLVRSHISGAYRAKIFAD